MASKSKKRKMRYTDARKRAESSRSGYNQCIKLPANIKQWNPKAEGVYEFNILPYVVGEGNPQAQAGELHFERTYFAHKIAVGGGHEMHTCSWKAKRKKCYPCKHTAMLASNPKTAKELLDSLRLKERQLFLVQVPDEGPEPMIWDISFHLFGKFLDAKIKKSPKYGCFHRLDKGYRLRVGATEKSAGQGKCLEFNDIEFRKRKEQLDDIDVEDLPCLDDCIVIPDYDQLKEVFLSGVSGKAEEDDDDEDEDEDDEEDSDDDEEDEDDEDDDDEDEPKKGKKKAKKKKKKRSKDDDEDEDEDDDEEDEEDDDEDEDEDEDEEDEDDDDEPLTAKEAGIKKGSKVKHDDHGKCKVVKISGDGTKLKIKDSDGDTHTCSVDEVKNLSKSSDDDAPF